MFKVTLATALLASASASVTQQETLKAAAAISQQAKKNFHNVQAMQSAKALSAVNDFKLANKGVTLQATGVSKRASKTTSVRALRGKGGKGKGKGKDDDEEEMGDDAGSGTGVVAPPTFFQISSGMCAGSDMGFGPLAEDLYFYQAQMKSGACFNMIMEEGAASSYSMHVTAEPFSVTEKSFLLHDCQDSQLVLESDMTAMFSFGGSATADGVCTAMPSGGAIKLVVSDTSLVMPAGVVGTAESGRVNQCVGGDLSSYDTVELEAAGLTIFGGYHMMCTSSYESDDDANDDIPLDSGSYEYDVSGCGAGSLTINTFSDNDCSVPTGTVSEDAKFCFFDYEMFADDMAAGGQGDFYFTSHFCSAL